VRFPDDTKRHAIVGTTGSGKSYAAAWHLSRRSWDTKPWIVYDPKRDDLIAEIPGTREIGMHEPIPEVPGIYLVHNLPGELDAVIDHMWKIYARENTGVYVDEGYMVSGGSANGNPALRAILTQGRSKHIPLVMISQRPVWMDRFVWAESEFIQIFRLNDRRDRESVKAFVPIDLEKERLPEYHSYYYDVGENEIIVLKPVPDKKVILSTFHERYERMMEKTALKRHRFI
jgi:hypothetical protein